MGGQGSGRPTKEESLIRQFYPKNNNDVAKNTGTPAGNFIIPNLSGDHSAGTLNKTPFKDNDLVNKKYVDDSVSAENLWDRSVTTLTPHTATDTVYLQGPLITDGVDVVFRTLCSDYMFFVDAARCAVGIHTNVLPATLSVGGTINATDTITGSNLSGTNTGDQTSIVGITGTKAQFDTAVTDGNIAYAGGAYHDGFSDFVAAEHVSLPNTITNVLSDHNLATHTALGLFDQSLDVDHDATTNFVAAEHIDWTNASSAFSTSSSGYFGDGILTANTKIIGTSGEIGVFQAKDQYHRMYLDGSANITYFVEWGEFRWLTAGSSTPKMILDTNGNLDIVNNLTAGTIKADNGVTGSYVVSRPVGGSYTFNISGGVVISVT